MLRCVRRLLVRIGVKFEDSALESAYQKWQSTRVYSTDIVYLMGIASSAAMFPVYSSRALSTSTAIEPDTCQDPELSQNVQGQDSMHCLFALTLLIMMVSTWATSNHRYDRWRGPMLSISYFYSLYAFLDISTVRTEKAYGTAGETGAKYIVTSFLVVMATVVGLWAQWEVVVLRMLFRFLGQAPAL